MNSNAFPVIQTYDDLVAERVRLETLIEKQKNIIRHDLDELKLEFKKELRPAIETANYVKKFVRPETRNSALLAFTTNTVIDVALKRMLKNSNIILQVIIPKMLKNYTSHFIHNLTSPFVSNGRPALKNRGETL